VKDLHGRFGSVVGIEGQQRLDLPPQPRRHGLRQLAQLAPRVDRLGEGAAHLDRLASCRGAEHQTQGVVVGARVDLAAEEAQLLG
jgi:hypothetical protein